MTEWTQRLRQRMDALGFAYDDRAPERLAAYHAMLCEWNERMNLTRDAEFEVALDRHYMDSLALLARAELFAPAARLIDVGSGAGFPGLPLAIARPDLHVTLLDSLQKRVGFLDAVVEKLALSNVHTVHARAEDGAHDPTLREKYDLAVARAVAPLPVLMELLLPFVRIGGVAVCYKGPAAAEEAAEGARAARMLGGSIPNALPVELPSQPEWRHCLIVSRKNGQTARQYPRKAGTPAKEPLGRFGNA